MDINGPLHGKALQSDVSSARHPVKTDKAQGTKPPQFSGAGAIKLTSETTSLSRLTTGLRQIPEVREDVVSRVKENLASGHYLSKEAAQSTATAILRGR